MTNERPVWRRVPEYVWCMADGSIYYRFPGQSGPHGDGSSCKAEHRPVAVKVTHDEYPEYRRVST